MISQNGFVFFGRCIMGITIFEEEINARDENFTEGKTIGFIERIPKTGGRNRTPKTVSWHVSTNS